MKFSGRIRNLTVYIRIGTIYTKKHKSKIDFLHITTISFGIIPSRLGYLVERLRH